MYLLQLSDKFYNMCEGVNPKLLGVSAKFEETVSISVTIEIDGTPITVNLMGPNQIDEVKELNGHLNKYLKLKQHTRYTCEIEAFVTTSNDPDANAKVVCESSSVDQDPGGETNTPVEEQPEAEPQQSAPETKCDAGDKTKRAGAPSKTRGCPFRNRSFE